MAGYDRITPEGKRFYAQLEELKKLEVRIGYQQGKAESEEGIDMCDIAMWNELGTEGSNPIPSRPFLRKSVDENLDTIKAFCKAQISKITKGATAEHCLTQIGVLAKGLVQDKIESGQYTPNAPSTIKRKKSDKPLIDTGRLRQSVSFFIRGKGEK